MLDRITALRKPTNIEQLFRWLDGLTKPEENDLFPFAGGWRVPVDDSGFRHSVLSLKKRIWKLLQGWLDFDGDNSYLRELDRYCSCGEVGADTHFLNVFTLNYDLSVETAFEAQIGNGVWTGFDNPPGEVEPSRLRIWDSSGFENPGIRLYKLHGSVNWGVAKQKAGDEPPLTQLTAAPVPLFEPRSSGYSWGHESWVPMEVRESVGYYLDPWGRIGGMIFGGNDKLASYPPFPFLQSELARSIEEAAIIVVVGYSWGDEYLNLILEREATLDPKPDLIVDVSRNAREAATDPRKQFATLFVGGGAKSALAGENVEVAFKGHKTVYRQVDNGLIGAIKAVPELAGEAGVEDWFSLGSAHDKFERLLAEAYSDKRRITERRS